MKPAATNRSVHLSAWSPLAFVTRCWAQQGNPDRPIMQPEPARLGTPDPIERTHRMSRTLRIGVQIAAADPLWVQVREAVHQAVRQPEVDSFPLDVIDPYALSADEHLGFVEELLAQGIDALISLDLPESLAQRALQLGIPVINLVESDLRHPLFVSPYGLYDIAREISLFLAQKLAGRGRLLVVGGLMFHRGEDGRSRLSGVADALQSYPTLAWRHLPSLWTYASAAEQVRQTAWPAGEHFDALFGFSDSLALGGRDAGRALGLLDERALVVGINGDPLALAAILEGSMTATVQTSPTDIGSQAVDLACRAALKQPLPPHFSYKPLFVTAENVGEVAVQKLAAIASLPSLLIGDSRRQAQARLAQLETGLKINQQVGAQLDRQRLLREIANLIRVSYGYDIVQAFLWDEATRILTLPEADGASRQQRLPLDDAGLLAEALSRSQAVFIPDTHHSHRFSVDPAWPETRSRVIVPIRLGEKTLGLLDLYSRVPRQHARQDLIGLQSIPGRPARHRSAERRAVPRSRGCARRRRKSGPDQDPAAGQREPRAAHPAQRRPGLCLGGAGDAQPLPGGAAGGAAARPAAHLQQRRTPAAAHQRPARPLARRDQRAGLVSRADRAAPLPGGSLP